MSLLATSFPAFFALRVGLPRSARCSARTVARRRLARIFRVLPELFLQDLDLRLQERNGCPQFGQLGVTGSKQVPERGRPPARFQLSSDAVSRGHTDL